MAMPRTSRLLGVRDMSADPRSVTEVDEEIGARIRARRQELGFPQSHVAELVGITFQQLQKYEAGQNRVSAATLLRVAAALRVDASELLPGAARKPGARSAKASPEDGMALQLQHAFTRIKSARERRLILDLAKRLGSDAGSKKRGRG